MILANRTLAQHPDAAEDSLAVAERLFKARFGISMRDWRKRG